MNKYTFKSKLENKVNILVIGIGNLHRGDDGAGPFVARKLKEFVTEYVNIIENCNDSLKLIDLWKDTDYVIIVDAACSGAKPGTIYRFDALKQTIPKNFFHFSTHSIGIAELIELSRTLNKLPKYLVVYGIEGKGFEAGNGLSLEVEKTVRQIIRFVKQDIETITTEIHGISLK